jgi:hypothetical protein
LAGPPIPENLHSKLFENATPTTIAPATDGGGCSRAARIQGCGTRLLGIEFARRSTRICDLPGGLPAPGGHLAEIPDRRCKPRAAARYICRGCRNCPVRDCAALCVARMRCWCRRKSLRGRLGGYFFAAVELLLKQVSLNGSGTFCGSFGAGDGAGVGCGTAGFGMASGMSSGFEPG